MANLNTTKRLIIYRDARNTPIGYALVSGADNKAIKDSSGKFIS